ncbi:sigma-54-dependent Fis family transcriptional regulator [Tomitella biformata]|uniref:sigma-54-dependent Fis family transcriptional regulator n=1 Tax=Tomitella biformata TaxID=630403 RepID=UPI000465AF23|nr:helix-turn-helix domain-containing protein [Tomitella biformata]
MQDDISQAGGLALRTEIAMSWKRSRLSGVDPGLRLAVPTLVDVAAPAAVLLSDAARPVLSELADRVRGSGVSMVLADRDCRIIDRYFDPGRVERVFDRTGLVPGTELSEDRVGTNALGTALELGRGLAIHGAEHFAEDLKDFSCYGHPIRHPITRRIEGVLDITVSASMANPLFEPLVVRAVADIEQRLLDGAQVSDRRLMVAFQAIARQPGVAVAALGVDLVLSNPLAMDVLEAADHTMLRRLAETLGPGGVRLPLVLASGEQMLVDAQRVEGSGRGALFQLRPVARTATPIRRGGGSVRPARDPVGAELTRLRAAAGSVVLLGESGSGLTSAARAIADGQDSAGLAVRIIEQAHLLDAQAARALERELSDDGPRHVLTVAAGVELSAEVAMLVAACAHRYELPPLRARGGELAQIVRGLVTELDREASLRFPESVLGMLAAQPWPGNLTELKAMLARVLAKRTMGLVGPEDVPAEYRVSARAARLSDLERAERHTIIGALARHGGNKSHAAAALGISRTTLYARLRALDISG